MIKLNNILNEVPVIGKYDFENSGMITYVNKRRVTKIIEVDDALGFETFGKKTEWTPKQFIMWNIKDIGKLISPTFKLKQLHLSQNKIISILILFTDKVKGTIYLWDTTAKDIKRVLPRWIKVKSIFSITDLKTLTKKLSSWEK